MHKPLAILALSVLPGCATTGGGLPARVDFGPSYASARTSAEGPTDALDVAAGGSLALVFGSESFSSEIPAEVAARLHLTRDGSDIGSLWLDLGAKVSGVNICVRVELNDGEQRAALRACPSGWPGRLTPPSPAPATRPPPAVEPQPKPSE